MLVTTPDMNADIVPMDNSVLASFSVLRPQCSGSRHTPGRLSGLPNPVCVGSTSWLSPAQAVLLVPLIALAVFPTAVSAAPPILRRGINGGSDGLYRRDSSNSQSSGSISMSVWLPILIVTVVFTFFSLCTCVRRCAARDATASTTTNRATASTNGNGNTASTTTTRPRRRPQRTPSQISTKSLPAYMKEPGDQELVLYRGPEETEDDHTLPHAMPMLTDDDDEHPDMRNGAFDIALDRIESTDTMADPSMENLLRRVSVSVPRPPELHHATVPHHHHRSRDGFSMDSAGSEAELLAHRRTISVESHPDPRGETPSYAEAVEAGMATISLNDPVSHNATSSPAAHTADPTNGRGRSRFSFLAHNPFSSRSNVSNASPYANSSPQSTRSESPALPLRTGSTLSRFSSRDSHETLHSRAPSRNNNLSRVHTRSNSNLLRAFRSHSPGLQAGASTISLDSISAPLTHTATRAEFRAPKGGLTAEQIKLITSREALEKFGVPYGPDAVAAFTMSRERLAEMGSPPEFESVTEEHQEEAGGSRSGSGASEAAVETTAQALGNSDTTPPRSPSISPSPQPSLSHELDVLAGSTASSDVSYATPDESAGEGHSSQVQPVEVYPSGNGSGIGEAEELRTAQLTTPPTARP